MDIDVQSKTDQVKDLALRGKDLQDFCKGKPQCLTYVKHFKTWDFCTIHQDDHKYVLSLTN